MLGSNPSSLSLHPLLPQAQPGTQTIATIPLRLATASQHPSQQQEPWKHPAQVSGGSSQEAANVKKEQLSVTKRSLWGHKGLDEGPGFDRASRILGRFLLTCCPPGLAPACSL